ncbi:MAG: DUF309 domain-containing protein [Acidobacteria bacterium]|nr:DUF309 domain-containing protein [Acidobacteriota bacterium]
MPDSEPSPAIPEQVREGLELFNRGEFFECHEVLELAWRAEPGPDRTLYQGVIQAAVAMFHVRRGRWQPAQIMLRRALPRLRLFEPAWRGVDVRRLVSELERCSASLERLGPDRIAELSSGPFPRIRF